MGPQEGLRFEDKCTESNRIKTHLLLPASIQLSICFLKSQRYLDLPINVFASGSFLCLTRNPSALPFRHSTT